MCARGTPTVSHVVSVTPPRHVALSHPGQCAPPGHHPRVRREHVGTRAHWAHDSVRVAFACSARCLSRAWHFWHPGFSLGFCGRRSHVGVGCCCNAIAHCIDDNCDVSAWSRACEGMQRLCVHLVAGLSCVTSIFGFFLILRDMRMPNEGMQRAARRRAPPPLQRVRPADVFTATRLPVFRVRCSRART